MASPEPTQPEYKFLKVFQEHSFKYNPRDENRFLALIVGEKQIPEEKKIKILKAFEAGRNRQYFQAKLAFDSEVKIITKIMSIREDNGQIVAKFQNGFEGSFDPHMISDNADDFYNAIQGLVFVKIRNKKIVDIYPVEPPNNYEIAQELLDLATEEYATFKLLLQAFGYDILRMSDNDALLNLPRLFPLFKSPLTGRRINIIEISNRGTGKTTTFTILQEFMNFRYYTEMPTYANLIYDARNNVYGAVFLSNGLIFDEIQNWRSGVSKSEIDSINATLSTGLENCIWTRGAGAESNFHTIHKCIPIIYSGNPLSGTLHKLTEEDMEDYLLQYNIFTLAILDRIHIIQIAQKPTFDKIINGKVLYPSVLRALVELIQRKIEKQTNYILCENLSSRRSEQAIDIQLILKALDIGLREGEVPNEEICKKVYEYMRFTNIGVS